MRHLRISLAADGTIRLGSRQMSQVVAQLHIDGSRCSAAPHQEMVDLIVDLATITCQRPSRADPFDLAFADRNRGT
jgi:hypothetical protein